MKQKKRLKNLQISKKKIISKIKKKQTNKKIASKKSIKKNKKISINKNKKKVIDKTKKSFDICKIIDECTIDEISKYLIKEGNKRGFPDITTRQ